MSLRMFCFMLFLCLSTWAWRLSIFPSPLAHTKVLLRWLPVYSFFLSPVDLWPIRRWPVEIVSMHYTRNTMYANQAFSDGRPSVPSTRLAMRITDTPMQSPTVGLESSNMCSDGISLLGFRLWSLHLVFSRARSWLYTVSKPAMPPLGSLQCS